MKSKIITIKEEYDTDLYPKLMLWVGYGDVVLFSSLGTGTVVYGGHYRLGYFSDDWNMSKFSDFDKTIKLSN